MLKKRLLALFLALNCSLAFSYSISKPLTKSVTDYVKVSKKKDLIAAEKIVELYRYLNGKGKKPKKNIITHIKHSKLFSDYTPYINTLLDESYCHNKMFLKEEKSDNIISLLHESSKKKCHQNFIKKLSKKKNLSLNDFEYIKDNFKYLLKKPYDETIATLIKRESEINAELKIFIRGKYIAKEVKPSTHIINILELDAELTRLLQEINYYSNLDKQYLTKELNRIFRQVKRDLKKGNTKEAGQHLEELVTFHSNNKELLQDYNFDKKLHYIARLTLKSPDLKLQETVFNFSKKLKEEDSFNETIFQIVFKFVTQENSYQATKFVAEKKLLSQLETLSSKNRYWIARAFEMNREITEAKEIYVKQIELVPFSFYSILALERLKILNPNYDSRFLVKQSHKNDLFSSTTEGKKEIEKMDIWLKVGSYRFFMSQKNHFLKNCNNIVENKNDLHLSCEQVLIKLFSQNGHYIEGFKLAYRFLEKGAVEFDDTLLETLFPIRYKRLISKTGITEKIILSLIRQESGFNRYARSSAGARGLMQLMPATARIFRKNLSKRRLYDPKLNIRIGSSYLKYLLKKYDGNLTFVFAAYNAGEGNLGRWMRQGLFKGSPLENIEQIPFQETRMYVKLLYRNMFFYNMRTAQRKVSSINSENSLLNYKLKH